MKICNFNSISVYKHNTIPKQDLLPVQKVKANSFIIIKLLKHCSFCVSCDCQSHISSIAVAHSRIFSVPFHDFDHNFPEIICQRDSHWQGTYMKALSSLAWLVCSLENQNNSKSWAQSLWASVSTAKWNLGSASQVSVPTNLERNIDRLKVPSSNSTTETVTSFHYKSSPIYKTIEK